jgi:AcrR family transcriptional regulator
MPKADPTSLTESLAERSMERSLAERRASYVEDIKEVVEATYRVITRTGSFDPGLRDILKESGLSTQTFYKHFRSKDELLLVLLDDGRRKLDGYLRHRMDKVSSPAGRIRAWIEGVLHQAANPQAAARTRPFLAHRDRLAERFPVEQQASVDLLVDLLAEAIGALPGRKRADVRGARRDAQAIYDVTFGALHTHLVHAKRPAKQDVEHLVRFCLDAVGEGKGTKRG